MRLRAGHVTPNAQIGDRLADGSVIGVVRGPEEVEVVIAAPFDGVLRGLIHPSVEVTAGMKIGDLDPRIQPEYCYTVSDKALAIGGGVLEAIMTALAPKQFVPLGGDMTRDSMTLWAIPGMPIVRAGDDIAALIADRLHAQGETLQAGDILVIAQKIVSKAEGRLVRLDDVEPSDEASALAEVVDKDAQHGAGDPRRQQVDRPRPQGAVDCGAVVRLDLCECGRGS